MKEQPKRAKLREKRTAGSTKANPGHYRSSLLPSQKLHSVQKLLAIPHAGSSPLRPNSLQDRPPLYKSPSHPPSQSGTVVLAPRGPIHSLIIHRDPKKVCMVLTCSFYIFQRPSYPFSRCHFVLMIYNFCVDTAKSTSFLLCSVTLANSPHYSSVAIPGYRPPHM